MGALNAKKEPPPCRTITIPGKWLERTPDGNISMLEEDYVRIRLEIVSPVWRLFHQ